MTINELSSYLANQPANTKDTPYSIALKIDNEADFWNLKTTLGGATDKYVYLDLSDSTVTTIPNDAFFTPFRTECNTLTGITLPDSITIIGDHAFFRCANLTDLTIPYNVQSIGKSAFACCTSLKSVLIPDNVKIIKHNAFRNCTNLIAINVDSGNTMFITDNGVLYNKSKTTLII
jgi:hypothetical protein